MPTLPEKRLRAGSGLIPGGDPETPGTEPGPSAQRVFAFLDGSLTIFEEPSSGSSSTSSELLPSAPDITSEPSPVNALIRTFVPGLDEGILKGGIPEGHIVLIRGPTGAMKTSLAYYILHENAVRGTQGLYVTVEQNAESLLAHAASLGLATAPVSDFLPILDLSNRDQLASLVRHPDLATGQDSEGEAVLAAVKGIIKDLKRSLRFRILVLDSWDGLCSLVGPLKSGSGTLDLFEWLWELGGTSFIVSENPPDGSETRISDEQFLADGILSLTVVPSTDTDFERRIRCTKMRCVDQDHTPHTLRFEGGRLEAKRLVG